MLLDSLLRQTFALKLLWSFFPVVASLEEQRVGGTFESFASRLSDRVAAINWPELGQSPSESNPAKVEFPLGFACFAAPSTPHVTGAKRLVIAATRKI
jgi:hypothetical protein